MNTSVIKPNDPTLLKLATLIRQGRDTHVYSSPVPRPLGGGAEAFISNCDVLVIYAGHRVIGFDIHPNTGVGGELDVMVSRARLGEVANKVDPASDTLPVLTLLHAVIAVMERDIKKGVSHGKR